MTGLTDLTVLETLQNIQNERVGCAPMSVWNDNLPVKKQDYKKKFETELNKLNNELLGIQRYLRSFQGSRWGKTANMPNIPIPQITTDRKNEIHNRMNELRYRVGLFKQKDTVGMFVYECADLETKIDELSNQILSAGYQVPTKESLQNESYFPCMSFNNPSK